MLNRTRTAAAAAVLVMACGLAAQAQQTKARGKSTSKVDWKPFGTLPYMWEHSLEGAKKTAAQTDSLIFYFTLLGELDGGC